MKSSKKLLLASLIVLSNTAFSQEIYNKDGFEVGVNGFLNLGIKSANYDLDKANNNYSNVSDYKNNKIGIDEDAAQFDISFKKKILKFEIGGALRYGSSHENNLERTGGELYAKYNFNDKLSLKYQKFDYGYTKLAYDSSGWYPVVVTGKENGTGYQLDLSAPGQWRSLVLDNDVSQFGNAFLGLGMTGMSWSGGEFTPNGKVWNSFMAYSTNYVDYGIKPNTLNLEYNSGKLGVVSSLAYNNQEVSDSIGSATATNKGLTVKGSYKINDKTLVGGGVSYGDGKTDKASSTDTEIIAQNAYYQTNIKGFDLYTEVAHSKYELTGTNTYGDSNSEKELIGVYGKVSKFTRYGIPAVELKAAQSTFDKIDGTEYADAQKNTLIELTPSYTVFLKKIPGAMASVNATLGKYKSENIDGTNGNNADGTQVKFGTYLTYFF